MTEVYDSFFPKKVCDNFKLIDDYFDNVHNEKCEKLINTRFLDVYVKQQNMKMVKDSITSDRVNFFDV